MPNPSIKLGALKRALCILIQTLAIRIDSLYTKALFDLTHMNKTFLTIFLFVLSPSVAWSAITIGDFTLGSPKKEVIQLLKNHFSSVSEINGSRYQVIKRFTTATQPVNAYKLGDTSIREINVFFTNDDLLKQVEIKINTTRIEDVKKLIPQVERATVEPTFGNSWEIFSDDGEITYWVSDLSDSGQISFADKPTSTENIKERRTSNHRFKKMTDKLDDIKELLLKNQNPEIP
jgi:hypothetical protein